MGDLSLLARLGGHSAPRTHRGAERFPGMTITYALIQMMEKIAERCDKSRIVTKANVFKLLTSGKACVGCVYSKGGGLAGVSAGNTLIEHGAKVVLLDKSAFCGGNSTKATSGINGADTKTQKAKGIQDSVELFTSDTLKGGAKRPEVAKVLCGNSGADVDWLVEKFDLDLSLVARLGGHSAPRTHRGAERFPGMTIT